VKEEFAALNSPALDARCALTDEWIDLQGTLVVVEEVVLDRLRLHSAGDYGCGAQQIGGWERKARTPIMAAVVRSHMAFQPACAIER
jgi:hypothetical protein